MTGPFEDVREQEQDFIRAQKDRIDQTQRAIGLPDRVTSLKGSPGWQEFVAQVEGIRSQTRRDMEKCPSDSGDKIRILQGRCQALGSMLSIMKTTENNRKALAVQLKEHQDILEKHVRPDGKVVPIQPIGGQV